ncbi:MAG TPA: hypothetical protein VI248_27855 [Kineosporiaceae bacterium]
MHGHLITVGHNPRTAQDQAFVVAHLSRWLEQEHLVPSELVPDMLDRFLKCRRRHLHADLAVKEQALARTAPPGSTTTRLRPADQFLAFLENLWTCRDGQATTPPHQQRYPPNGPTRHNRPAGMIPVMPGPA